MQTQIPWVNSKLIPRMSLLVSATDILPLLTSEPYAKESEGPLVNQLQFYTNLYKNLETRFNSDHLNFPRLMQNRADSELPFSPLITLTVPSPTVNHLYRTDFSG